MYLRLLLKAIVIIVILLVTGCARQLDIGAFPQQYQRLTQRYEQLLEHNPDDAALRMKLAQFYYDFRNYQKIKAILGNSQEKEARTLLAKSLAKLKEYNYAIEVFEQLDIDPAGTPDTYFYSEYFYLYGEVLESKNLFPKAIEVYRNVRGAFQEQAKVRIGRIKSKREDAAPPHITELSSQAQTFLKEVKDEAAIIYFVDEVAEITEENTSVWAVHVIEQILQERAKGLGEIEIGYDSTYERVELEFARAISADGKVAYAGQENIRDVSRYLNFPLYSNSRVLIISMPLVEVGSFIEYKLKVYSSKLINEDDFSFIYQLRERYPIFKAQFVLTVPQHRQVHFKFFNKEYAGTHSLDPVVTEKDGKKTYVWKLKNIKPLIPEYNMPPAADINPAILISSFSSWDEIYQWWQPLYQDKLILEKETQEFVRKLIEGSSTDLEKAKRIHEFCAREIRYVAVEYGESGHEPHQAQEVFINRYGDCKDQAILLMAMLEVAGIKGYPVLIPTRTKYPVTSDFPSINFNHAICAIEIGENLFFVDPTAETASFFDLPLSDQDRSVMVFYSENARIVKTPQLQENGAFYQMHITLDKDENATIKRTVTTKGFFTSGHRWYFQYTHPEKIKENLQEKMVEISSFSQLLNYEIKNIDDFDVPPVLEYTFVTEKFLNPAGDLRIIPILDEMRLDYNLIGKDQRRFPIDFDGMYTKSATITIVLPDNLQLKYLPQDRRVDTPWFDFTYSYNVKDNTLTCRQQFSVKKKVVQQDEYGIFKQALEKVMYFLREEVILEKGR